MLWEGNCGTGKQQIPVQSPRDKIPEDLRKRKRPEITLREESALGGELRNWKTANPHTEPQRIYGRRKRPEIALREERALGGELRNWNRRLEKWQKQE